MEGEILLKEKQNAFLLKHNTDKQEDLLRELITYLLYLFPLYKRVDKQSKR